MGKASVTIGDHIAVDYFVRRKRLKYFFLTHAHMDHCSHLNSRWNHALIYCSVETARILPVLTKGIGDKEFGVSDEWLKPLSLNEPHPMPGFTVTLIDANHVVGSVMFLFEGPSVPDGPVLCTGDFRADTTFFANSTALSILQRHVLNTIYLDNTYMESSPEEFPSREQSVEKAVDILRNADSFSKIIVITNRLGREQFLIQLSQSLDVPIALHDIRQNVAEALGIHNHFAPRGADVRIHTYERKDISKLLSAEAGTSAAFDVTKSLIVEVTMLGCLKNDVLLRGDNVRIVEYSDHSSLREIRDFLSILKFRRLVGTAENINIVRRNELLAYSLLRNRDAPENHDPHMANEDDAEMDAEEVKTNAKSGEEICFEKQEAALDEFKKGFLEGVERLVNDVVIEDEAIVGGSGNDTDLHGILSAVEGRVCIEKIIDAITSRVVSNDMDSNDRAESRMPCLQNTFLMSTKEMSREQRKRYENACDSLVDWPQFDETLQPEAVNFDLHDVPHPLPEIQKQILERVRNMLRKGDLHS